MATLYLCDVIGDGQTPDTAFRPDIPAGDWVVLMLHEAKGKAVVMSTDDELSGAGIISLLTAATIDDLRQKAKTTRPSAAKRTVMNTWLSANDYTPLPAGETWWVAIHHVARQVDPAADLNQLHLGST